MSVYVIYIAIMMTMVCGIYSLFGMREVQIAIKKEQGWRTQKLPIVGKLMPIVHILLPLLERYVPQKSVSCLGRQLHRSGLQYDFTAAEFYILRIVLCVLLCSAMTGYAFLWNKTIIWSISAIVISCLVSFLYSKCLLTEYQAKRYKKIVKQFPFFLDLLILAIKSGLNLTMAMKQVSMVLPIGPLREEIDKWLRDVNSGISNEASFDALADRVVLLPISNFVMAVKQTALSGGELCPALVGQSKQNLADRFLRAEKLANEAPVKMLFPLVLFLFPLTLLIIAFPIAVKTMESGALQFIR